jgi:low affinity Fe/Cu permease
MQTIMSTPINATNPEPATLRDRFVNISRRTSDSVGSVWAFVAAFLVIIVWGITGPLFHFSDTWQLVINTGTTIVTFLMVFLIQSTQNRDSKAVHLKLDELIRAVRGARNNMVDLEKLSEKELQDLADEFSALHDRACAAAKTKDGRKQLRAVEAPVN